MPKNILKIDNFSGGLNSSTDKGHIADNELSLSDGINTFDHGKIKQIGQFEDETIDNAEPNVSCMPGTGLFAFKSDKINGHIHVDKQYGTINSISGNHTTNILILNISFPTFNLSPIPADTWKDCVLFLRDGDYAGQAGEILGNSEGYLDADFEIIQDSNSDFNDGSNQLQPGTRCILVSKNEKVDYIVRVDDDADAGVKLTSYQENTGQSSGPSHSSYPLGTDEHQGNYKANVSFYYVDGGLRWSNGAAEHKSSQTTLSNGDTYNSSNQFLGFIKTNILHLSNINTSTNNKRASSLEVNQWVQTDSYLIKPDKWSNSTHTSTINTIRVVERDHALPTAAGSWQLGLQYNDISAGFDGTGTWSQDNSDYYEYYASYIYQNGGESGLESLGGLPTANADCNLGVQVKVNTTDYLVDKRIVGVKIYWSKKGTAYFQANVSKNYMLLCEFHIEKGFKSAIETSYTPCYFSDDGSVLMNLPYEFKDPPLISSWQSETGFLLTDTLSDVRFSTSVVVNRRVYIANIIHNNRQYGDALLKSPVNMFDMFPISNKIESSILDGDQIVKLEEHADRILQFKSKKLEIINVSQEYEFLEEVYHNKGVTSPGSTCKTDYGIAWVNEFGAYLFDGSKIINLLEKKNMRIISSTEWKDFINYGYTSDIEGGVKRYNTPISPIIGYLPNERQIIITNGDGKYGEENRFYIYNLISQTWTKSKNNVGMCGLSSNLRRTELTNFILNKDNKLAVNTMSSSNFISVQAMYKVYNNDFKFILTSRDFIFYTKAFDFGSPGVDKTIYKVYFHYKGDGTKVAITMYDELDGSTNSDHSFDNGSGSIVTAPLSNSPTTDTIESFKVYNNTAKNIKRIWFVFSGTSLVEEFELYDINIVYKTRRIK